MSKIVCTLDACTVINLILIDEEDYLLKKLNLVDLHLAEKVFYEIKQNIYKEISSSEYERKTIEQSISYFRGKQFLDDTILADFGKSYFNKIKKITNYDKLNGEFYSIALTMCLSRVYNQKVYFYTDDFPAKEEFKEFYKYQQIGHIEDSVDFLLLIYWLDDRFSSVELDRFLSNLYSRYLTEHRLLISELRTLYQAKIKNFQNRNQTNFLKSLSNLIESIKEFDFTKSKLILNAMLSRQQREVSKIFEKHNIVFESSKHITDKIIANREKLKVNKIYKLMDLCD